MDEYIPASWPWPRQFCPVCGEALSGAVERGERPDPADDSSQVSRIVISLEPCGHEVTVNRCEVVL